MLELKTIIWADSCGMRRRRGKTTYVFLDSDVVSFNCNPNASAPALEKEPLIITLKHKRKIRKRECMRWDSTLEIKGTKKRGGWTNDGCSIAESDAEETKCKCTQTGTYAIMSKLKQPFDIPPEPEWVKLAKWICYGLSFAMLIFYIAVILFKRTLHEQFHIIRLNLAVAALGGLVSFFLSPFFYEEEENCRILSILVHFFYTATGAWLTAESSALFSGLVNGSFGGMFTFHLLIGWVIPGGMIGGCFMVVRNYGYDYRCLVGPTAGMRWLLVSPILISTMLALVFATLTCVNYGTPAVKKTVIVNELSSATRANLIVSVLFLCTWLCGVFALVDLGFDGDEIPTFNPIFQILNACLGIFIVALIGFSSKHFRYCLCHSTKNRTKTKAINLDPFDVHDKAKINSRKKIYQS
nr:adhesion G-protein coupled receptor D1 [Parasteatoda tepidariorum]